MTSSVSATPCVLCAHEGQRALFPAPNNPTLTVVQCPGCGLISAAPRPDPARIRERYDDHYFQCATPLEGGYEDYLQDEPFIRKSFEKRLSWLTAFVAAGAPKTLLDVGCATGVFLDLMRERGWAGEGIEIAAFAREVARRRGFLVHAGEIDALPRPTVLPQLITLWDVLEHVADPLSTLRACHQRLAPGGLLVLSTPDASSLLARGLGRRWLGYRCVGEHLYFFSRTSLRRLLETAGFEVLDMGSVGKYLAVDRLITRLAFYTRVFRPFRWLATFLPSRAALYVNSGDTMAVVARKR